MGQNFSASIYLPCQDFFGRDVVVTPIMSNPGAPSYVARGIYGTHDVDVVPDAGMAILSDQETILDIRDDEYPVLPQQGDLITIPADGDVPAEGDFEVTDAARNGGGETTLKLRKWEPPAP